MVLSMAAFPKVPRHLLPSSAKALATPTRCVSEGDAPPIVHRAVFLPKRSRATDPAPVSVGDTSRAKELAVADLAA
jgi:hypothetical protein